MLPTQQYARGNVTRATEASAALVRFWWTIATNLIGPANLSFLAARIIVGRSEGHVVNVSSRVAFRGEPETPPAERARSA
jgi:short-subunit dehydrogenase involved in D-alanine esterification of teichoic acids